MSAYPNLLQDPALNTVRALVERDGLHAAAERLGISSPTLLRVLAKLPCQGTTISAIGWRLSQLDEPKQAA